MSAVHEYTLSQRFALGMARTLTDWAESSAALRRDHRAELAQRRAGSAAAADPLLTRDAERLRTETRHRALRERFLGPSQY